MNDYLNETDFYTDNYNLTNDMDTDEKGKKIDRDVAILFYLLLASPCIIIICGKILDCLSEMCRGIVYVGMN